MESFFYDQVAKWLPKYSMHDDVVAAVVPESEENLTQQQQPLHHQQQQHQQQHQMNMSTDEGELYGNPAKKARKTMDDELMAE